jgi:hypothetical protein
VGPGLLTTTKKMVEGRSAAVDATKKIVEDFEQLMDTGGDPAQSAELLKLFPLSAHSNVLLHS